jgi:tetratricopeptide (TPR) repeat protein/DNA-binding XRE family transcriptional regulator
MVHIGSVIRELRKKKGMTQEQLAEQICSRSYISRMEKGDTIPSEEILQLLAERLQVSCRTLLRRHFGPGTEQAKRKMTEMIRHVENREWDAVAEFLSAYQDEEGDEETAPFLAWVRGSYAENVLHQYERAREYYEESVRLSETTDVQMHIRSLLSLGYWYGKNGNNADPVQGYPYLKRAEELGDKHTIDGHLRISILLELGLFFFKTGNCTKAIHYFTEALKLNEAFRTDFRLGHAYTGLTIAYGGLKQYHEARLYAQLTVQYYESKRNDTQLLAGAYANLGMIHRFVEEYEEAVRCFQKAIDLARTTGSDYHIRNSQVELAITYQQLKRTEEARELCLEIIENSGSAETVAEAKFVLAELLLEAGEENQAITLLQDALAGFQAKRLVLYHLPRAYHLLGRLYKQKGDLVQALEMFEKSSEILLENSGHKNKVT